MTLSQEQNQALTERWGDIRGAIQGAFPVQPGSQQAQQGAGTWNVPEEYREGETAGVIAQVTGIGVSEVEARLGEMVQGLDNLDEHGRPQAIPEGEAKTDSAQPVTTEKTEKGTAAGKGKPNPKDQGQMVRPNEPVQPDADPRNAENVPKR